MRLDYQIWLISPLPLSLVSASAPEQTIARCEQWSTRLTATNASLRWTHSFLICWLVLFQQKCLGPFAMRGSSSDSKKNVPGLDLPSPAALIPERRNTWLAAVDAFRFPQIRMSKHFRKQGCNQSGWSGFFRWDISVILFHSCIKTHRNKCSLAYIFAFISKKFRSVTEKNQHWSMRKVAKILVEQRSLCFSATQ